MSLNLPSLMKPLSSIRIVLTVCSIVFVFSLPYLSSIGFAEVGGTSISRFIDNAHSTGAMAVVSYTPLTILLEYQNLFIDKLMSGSRIVQTMLRVTMKGFLGFFGAFLICNVSYCPSIHKMVVIMFGICFILHSILVLRFVNYVRLSKFLLIIGSLSLFSLLFVRGMWFWFAESIGYSSIVLFTPIELLCGNNIHSNATTSCEKLSSTNTRYVKYAKSNGLNTQNETKSLELT